MFIIKTFIQTAFLKIIKRHTSTDTAGARERKFLPESRGLFMKVVGEVYLFVLPSLSAALK